MDALRMICLMRLDDLSAYAYVFSEINSSISRLSVDQTNTNLYPNSPINMVYDEGIDPLTLLSL